MSWKKRDAWTSPRAPAGSSGGRISASASGARSARTTAPTAPPGTLSATTTPAAAPTAGARTASAGISDDQQILCFALALWNGRDPILKERLFGLTNSEGNHGEDVKECYYYLDATPTHSYLKMLYKYPQRAFPYAQLVEENRRRGKDEPEFELLDTGVFDDDRYFDVVVEYAKQSPSDILMRDHGPQPRPGSRRPARAAAALVPQHLVVGLARPQARADAGRRRRRGARATQLGTYRLYRDGDAPWLFTENETNGRRLFGSPDARRSLQGRLPRVRRRREPGARSTRSGAAPRPPRTIVSRCRRADRRSIRLRLSADAHADAVCRLRRPRSSGAGGRPTSSTTACRQGLTDDQRLVQRQALAGMIWSKQFFYYDVPQWLKGDPGQPPPPAERTRGRNHEWKHLNNADIISMPDKWEYPWYAAWDLAFHCIPLALVDPEFAKEQLRAADARVVHAPERPAAGLRVGVRRRQSAGARLGGLARLPDRSQAAPADSRTTRAISRFSSASSTS